MQQDSQQNFQFDPKCRGFTSRGDSVYEASGFPNFGAPREFDPISLSVRPRAPSPCLSYGSGRIDGDELVGGEPQCRQPVLEQEAVPRQLHISRKRTHGFQRTPRAFSTSPRISIGPRQHPTGTTRFERSNAVGIAFGLIVHGTVWEIWQRFSVRERANLGPTSPCDQVS